MNLWSMSTMSNSVLIRSSTASPRSSVWYSITSRNWPSTRTTGLREFMLLWNTVAMSVQRYWRSSSWSIVVMSVPSNDDRAAGDPARLLQQPQQGHAEGGLARPGLADQPDELPRLDREA